MVGQVRRVIFFCSCLIPISLKQTCLSSKATSTNAHLVSSTNNRSILKALNFPSTSYLEDDDPLVAQIAKEIDEGGEPTGEYGESL